MLGIQFARRHLNGRKTIIIGIGKILFGVALIIFKIWPENGDIPADSGDAFELISGGLLILFGSGDVTMRRGMDKIEKKIDRIQATTPAQPPERLPRDTFINPGHGQK